MTKGREYSPQLNREAVLLTPKPNASCRQTALDSGFNTNLLRCWKRELEQSQDKTFKSSG
ncbi:transposase [Salinimonas sediminis]|uniref:Transposase n=1 Tax=Salinimonas sediminis TaxID=2303538 RepID=A0A346NLC7_9ALTE|nr:transposase [Salinimonas sediminis]AXR06334.1 hypothetical protein D0Y50_08125 [Salinimonas sediminis]